MDVLVTTEYSVGTFGVLLRLALWTALSSLGALGQGALGPGAPGVLSSAPQLKELSRY